MILTKKRVATVEALSQRFGDATTITRAQILIALDEKLIPAWPYWLTDDLTLKVSRGVWNLPSPDEFTVAEKGMKATKPSTYRAMKAAGLEPPVFITPKPERTPKPKAEKKAATIKTKPLVVQVAVPKPARTRKPKTEVVPADETASTMVSPTV